MPESIESQPPLVEVGRYPRLNEARERSLVVAAKNLPYLVERDGDDWLLLVEESSREEILRELSVFEAEEEQPEPASEIVLKTTIPKGSLFLAAWILSGFFFAQQALSGDWVERGTADSGAILAGEWWRTITALTLHGNGPHLVANLACGLLFAAFLIPRLGVGVTWLAILLSGALGNALNAWGYRGETHLSIGASTACFGALGILVGLELPARWREPQVLRRWRLILPLGAGLGLLAFLGVGEEGRNVDFMAHFWGFVAGVVEGALFPRGRLATRWQWLAGTAALGLLAGAWVLAIR